LWNIDYRYGTSIVTPRSLPIANGNHGEPSDMRVFIGLILGCVLTVGGAYALDRMDSSSPTPRPMVNWDVVAKNFDNLTALAREGWKKVAG